MKILNLNKYLLGLCLLMLFSIIACNEEEEVGEFPFEDNSARLINEKLGGVDMFYEAAEKAGLLDLLTGETEYTFFVPTNEALQFALETNGFNSIAEADEAFLTTVVNNHAIEGTVLSSDLGKGSVTTLGGNTVYVSVEGGVFLNADGQVTNADNETQNGVVHIIDYPLINFPSSTINEIVDASASATEPEFTILQHALQYTGLDATLDGSELFTVFAPSDAAFEAEGLDIDSINALSVDAVTELLQFHVFSGRFFTIDLSSGRFYTIAGDEEDGVKGLDLTVAEDNVEIETAGGTSTTTSVNLLATNGTVHVVDAVITPESYLYDVLSSSALFDDYYAGMIASTYKFDSLLTREEEFTVFVPSSFNNTVQEDTLSETLLGHIFPGIITVDGTAGQRIESVNGIAYYAAEAANELVYINGRSRLLLDAGSPVLDDYETYNGLISLFNNQFVPLPEANVSDVISDDTDAMDSLYLFNAALRFLELDDLADVTYLYVNNDDFAAAYDEAGISADTTELENADIDVLEEIVNNHIITSVFFSNQLDDGVVLTDRNGAEVEIGTVSADGVQQFGILMMDEGVVSVISFTDQLDVLANNGVIHVLDDVLIY